MGLKLFSTDLIIGWRHPMWAATARMPVLGQILSVEALHERSALGGSCRAGAGDSLVFRSRAALRTSRRQPRRRACRHHDARRGQGPAGSEHRFGGCWGRVDDRRTEELALEDSRSLLPMRCDCNDGDDRDSFLTFDFIRAVVPKNAVSAGSIVLRVGLEHFLAMYAGQRRALVRIQAWVVLI